MLRWKLPPIHQTAKVLTKGHKVHETSEYQRGEIRQHEHRPIVLERERQNQYGEQPERPETDVPKSDRWRIDPELLGELIFQRENKISEVRHAS